MGRRETPPPSAAHGHRLVLLGAPRLLRGDAPVALPTRKSLALLAFLALEGRSTRARLAALLWRDADAEAARRNLRRELHRLRQAGLDATLVADGDALALAADVAVDLRTFEAALAAGDTVGALAAHTGPLLEGFEVADAPSFDDWMLDRREALQRAWLAALAAAAAAKEAVGATGDALALHRQLLAADPLQETHHRAVMRLLAARGDRAAALAAWEHCRRVLHAELGVAPLPETEALAQGLRGSVPPIATPPAPAVSAPADPLPAPATVPLAGRAADVEAMEAAWHRGLPICVLGEPGVGKTRLVRDFAAAHGPLALIQGRLADRDLPYALASRVLRALGTAEPDRALPTWVRETLARLLPEWAPPGRTLPPLDDGERLRLFDAYAEATARWAEGNFSALLFDDWHHADAASVEIEGYAAARTPAGGLRRLLTARGDELPAATRAQLEHAAAAGQALRLELQPLTPVETLALVRSLSGASAGQRFATRLHLVTGGNPYRILETLRHWFQRGELFVEAGGGWATRHDGQTEDYRELQPPADVVAAVVARVHAQGPAMSQLLEAASLADEPFDTETLDGCTALGEFELQAALESAARAGHLRPAETPGVTGWCLAHDLLGEALRTRMAPTRAALLHRRLAVAAERRGAPPAVVARHLEAAGRASEAVRWRMAAADAARRVGAREQALEHLDRALADGPGALDAGRIELGRGQLWAELGDADAALAAFERAAARADEPDDRSVWIDAELARAEFLTDGHDSRQALEIVDALLSDLPLAPLQAATAHKLRGDALRVLGDVEAADAAYRAALAVVPGSGGRLRARVLDGLFMAAYHRGDFSGARGWLDQSTRLFRSLGDRRGSAKASSRRGIVAMLTGERAEAFAQFERALAAARALRDVPMQREVILNLVKLHTDAGDVAPALALLREGEALAPDWESPVAHSAFLQAAYYCHYLAGDAAAARAAAGRVLAQSAALDEVFWQVGARLVVVDLFLHLAELDRAEAVLREAEALAAGHEIGHQQPELDLKCAWLDVLRGRAADALHRLAPWTGPASAQQAEDQAGLARVRAEAQLALGQPAAAAQTLAGVDGAPTAETMLRVHALRLQAARQLGAIDPALRAAAEAALQRPAPAFEAALLRETLEACNAFATPT